MSLRIINHILSGLLAVLASTAIIGCGSDSYDEPDTNVPDKTDTAFYLTLNISTADRFGSSSFSRAGDYYYEEPERKNEKMNNLRVYVVKDDGTLEAMRDVIRENLNDEISNKVTFKLSRGKKTVYLFANVTALPQNIKDLLRQLEVGAMFPASEFADAILKRNAASPFYTFDQDIPMCESFDVTLDRDDEGVSYVNADVFVTRIAVKYTFICREPADKVTVRLKGMATRQYFMPNEAVYTPGKYEAPEVIDGISGRSITKFNAPGNPGLADFELTLAGCEEIELTDDSGKKSKAYRYDPVYLMETPGTEFSMSLCLADGNKTGTGTWFPEQTLPNLPLLPRNTHVVVYMGVNKSELDCTVDVLPYRGCILDPYFGLEPKQ